MTMRGHRSSRYLRERWIARGKRCNYGHADLYGFLQSQLERRSSESQASRE